jgi:hypothetical protein
MILFWASMLVAQAGAFVIFKDLADISQWLVQSNRKFTMAIWYNRYPIAAVSIAALLIALFATGPCWVSWYLSLCSISFPACSTRNGCSAHNSIKPGSYR